MAVLGLHGEWLLEKIKGMRAGLVSAEFSRTDQSSRALGLPLENGHYKV